MLAVGLTTLPIVDTSPLPATATATATASLAISGTATPSRIPRPTNTPRPAFSPTACSLSFTDVLTSSIFYADIQFLVCQGIVAGYPNADGTSRFEPNAATTRGQFAKIAVLSFGLPIVGPYYATFSDVDGSNLLYSFIESAAYAGAISGYPAAECVGGGTPIPSKPCYLPNEPVSRVQVAVITQRARRYALLTPTAASFQDVPAGSFGYQAIETLVHEGIISGATCSGTSGPLCFRPNDFSKRGELSKVVRRAISVLP